MKTDRLFSRPGPGKESFHFIDWGGSGPLVHIAHATGFCAGTYTPLAEQLTGRARVVGLDDRGHGKTRASADPKTLRNWDPFVEDLTCFFEFLQEPVVAVGHSRGGVVSLGLAVRRPDLIRALVLVDPTILPYSWMWLWFLAKKCGLARFIPIAANAARRRKVWPDRGTILEAYRRKRVFKRWQDGFLESYVTEGTEETGDGRVRLCCDPAWESRCFATCPHDVWGLLPRVRRPTLVIFGGLSDTFRPSAVRRFQRMLPQARLVCSEAAGHFVPMEQPEMCKRHIVEFMETLNGVDGQRHLLRRRETTT